MGIEERKSTSSGTDEIRAGVDVDVDEEADILRT